MLGRSEATPFWLAHSCRGPPSPALPASTCHQTGIAADRDCPLVEEEHHQLSAEGWHLLHEETVPPHEETVPLHEETIPLHKETVPGDYPTA